MVGKPDYSNSKFFKYFLLFAISMPLHHFIMDAAVDFDTESRFMAIEIKYKRSNDMLSSELVMQKLPVSNTLPEHVFSTCCILSQLT